MKNKELPNHIEEYIKENAQESTFQDLFEANKEDVDLRTDLTEEQVVLSNKILVNDDFIKTKFGFTMYDEFLNHFHRLRISLDRKSRGEFVDINRKDRFEQNLQRFGNFSNLMKVKE